MLTKWLNQISFCLKQHLELNTLTEDQLRHELLALIRNVVSCFLGLKDDRYLEQLSDIANTEKSISNIVCFLAKKIKRWPLKKIFKGAPSSFDSEGFDTDDHSSGQDDRSPKNKKSVRFQGRSSVEEDKETIYRELDKWKQRTSELQARVKDFENQIVQMTSDYLKDIQHLKLNFVRQIENPECEFVEVNYFDIKAGLEPEVRQYIEDKVDFVRKQYEQRVQFYRVQLSCAQVEADSYRKTIQIILSQHTLPAVVQTLFAMEKDIYKIWKQFQDLVGNKTFFAVFENQQGGYGINYREIDELLSMSLASQRILNRQKALHDEQLKVLVEDKVNKLKEAQALLLEKDNLISEMLREHESQVELIKKQMQDLLEQQLIDQRRTLEILHQKQLRKATKELLGVNSDQLIKSITLKAALSRWKDYATLLKFLSVKADSVEYKQLHQSILGSLQQTQQQGLLSKQFEQLQAKAKDQEMLIQFQEQEILQHKIEIEVLQKKNTKLQSSNEMFAATLQNQRCNLNHMESAIKIISKPLGYILQRMGYAVDLKSSIISARNLNLMAGGIEIQSFIQQLRENSLQEEMHQLMLTLLKGQITQELLLELPPTRHSSTLTEISDVRYEIKSGIESDQGVQGLEYAPVADIQVSDRTQTVTQKVDSVQSPRNILNDSERLTQRGQANVLKEYSPRSTKFAERRVEEERPNSKIQKTIPAKKEILEQGQAGRAAEKVKPRAIKTSVQYQQNEALQGEESQQTQGNEFQLTSYNMRKQFFKPSPRPNLNHAEAYAQGKKQDKAVQVNFQRQEMLNYKAHTTNVTRTHERKKHSIDSCAQDILVIMAKKEDTPQKSPAESRMALKGNQEGHRQHKIPDITLFQANKKRLNKTFNRDHSPDLSDTCHVNPFQFYQDVFKEKKKIQLKNFMYQQNDSGLLSKLVQDRKKFEGIEGKPLYIPPYLRQV